MYCCAIIREQELLTLYLKGEVLLSTIISWLLDIIQISENL